VLERGLRKPSTRSRYGESWTFFLTKRKKTTPSTIRTGYRTKRGTGLKNVCLELAKLELLRETRYAETVRDVRENYTEAISRVERITIRCGDSNRELRGARDTLQVGPQSGRWPGEIRFWPGMFARKEGEIEERKLGRFLCRHVKTQARETIKAF